MSETQWRRIQDLFEQAAGKPQGERDALLAQLRREDETLADEVVSLLEHDERAPADFLRTEGGDRDGGDGCDSLIGVRIAAFTVRRVIAAGGMGTVYEAEQERPKRLVALKVMNGVLAARQALRRFEYESQILARLQHSNIAQVYHAGTFQADEARRLPYFAMEYVEGARAITEYAREENISLRERLELFLTVCDAVQHGHQKGIIHRDLKPANILIDGTGHVKVIDFGVARATDSDVAVTTVRTDAGQLIGTLQYMSPEQCEADPEGLDTRSDVYSLGVVLFELLTSRLPYDVSHRSIPSATRMICNEPPLRPSSIEGRLRGDLDAIVLKAIEKDRDRRYGSVGDLAADIRRHLCGEAISARPPGRWRRTAQWAGRHPLAVTTTLCLTIGACVFAATALATWRLNFRPVRVHLADDGSAATLRSVLGGAIHTWPSGRGGIAFAELTGSSGMFGWGPVVAIGYGGAHDGPPGRALAVYDARSPAAEPIWRGILNDEDLPEILTVERGFRAQDFYVRRGIAADVFGQTPGKELIVAHQHYAFTQTALRIYSVDGKILYQVWSDAQVNLMFWMRDAKQLVLAGVNGMAYWPQRGYASGRLPHPSVVFTLHPEPGVVSSDYVGEVPGDGALDPVWYRCLWPPEATDHASIGRLYPAEGIQDAGRHVAISLWLMHESRPSVMVVLNDRGQEVPGPRELSDAYNVYRSELPDPEWFQLADLPPPVTPMRPGAAGQPVPAGP